MDASRRLGSRLGSRLGRFARASWTARTFVYHAAYNALTRAAPRWSAAVQRATRDTGRGRGRDGAALAAEYFEAVFDDYAVIAKASGACEANLFEGKRVLEIGPGDTRAMALLARCAGGAAWEGLDAFDIQSRDAKYTNEIYDAILTKRRENRRARDLLDGCRMHVSTESVARGGPRFDLVISRASLEHVRGLDALFAAVARVVRDDAILIHKIDLRSHGIEHTHALDFLRFSERAWHSMSSHIDLPNRARVGAYVDLAERASHEHGLRTAWIATTHVIDEDAVRDVKRDLATPFRALSSRELSVLGLWLVQVGPNHPLARAKRPRLRLDDIHPAPHALLSRH